MAILVNPVNRSHNDVCVLEGSVVCAWSLKIRVNVLCRASNKTETYCELVYMITFVSENLLKELAYSVLTYSPLLCEELERFRPILTSRPHR